MRATLILYLSLAILGLFLWIIFSGALLILGAIFWLFLFVVSIGYQDTVILFLLGAREVRSSDEKDFFEAASQEAYKLAVPMARLYFYNGTLERAFVFQNRGVVSIVLSKTLLEKCSSAELRGICFELFLQVKKGMALKRTRSMFFLGLITWMIHSFVGLILALVPVKEVRQAMDWLLNYFLHPCLDFMFTLMMGESYFKKLETLLSDFPKEKEVLDRVGMKLIRPLSYYSLPSRKLLVLSSVNKSRHFQSILALEFLPHEWDHLFKREELISVK